MGREREFRNLFCPACLRAFLGMVGTSTGFFGVAGSGNMSSTSLSTYLVRCPKRRAAAATNVLFLMAYRLTLMGVVPCTYSTHRRYRTLLGSLGEGGYFVTLTAPSQISEIAYVRRVLFWLILFVSLYQTVRIQNDILLLLSYEHNKKNCDLLGCY